MISASGKIGNVEFEIDGVVRGFRLGNYAISIAQKAYGAESVEALFRAMGIGQDNVGSLDATLCLFYGSAIHYHEHKKREIDFAKVDVSDWIEALGEEKVKEVFIELLRTYQSKNFRPPVNPGEMKSQ